MALKAQILLILKKAIAPSKRSAKPFSALSLRHKQRRQKSRQGTGASQSHALNRPLVRSQSRQEKYYED